MGLWAHRHLDRESSGDQGRSPPREVCQEVLGSLLPPVFGR